MSLFTSPMLKLTAVVLKSKAQQVSAKLLELGVIDFKELDHDENIFSDSDSKGESERFKALAAKIENLYFQANMGLPHLQSTAKFDDSNETFNEIDNYLDEVYDKASALREDQKQSSIKESLYKELDLYLSSKHDFIDVFIGSSFDKDLEYIEKQFEKLSAVIIPFDEDHLSILSLKRDRKDVSRILEYCKWSEKSNANSIRDAKRKFKLEIEKRINDSKKDTESLSKKLNDNIKNDKAKLDEYYKIAKSIELTSKMKTFFLHTDHTYLFTGWIPEKDKDDIVRALNTVCENKYMLSFNKASDYPIETIPVVTKTNKYLSVFQKLIDNYGIVQYKSVNPLIFTTIFFLIMYGLMFADAGQGLVLLLVGIIGKIYYKRNPNTKDKMISRYLSNLLLWLGPASIIGGVLFGSYFGFSWFKAIWFNYHHATLGDAHGPVRDVFGIMGITFKFGVFVIFTGLLINWVNLFRKKKYFEIIIDKNGIVGALLFLMGIIIGSNFVYSGYSNMSIEYYQKIIIIICLALLFLKEPLHTLLFKKKTKITTLIGKTLVEFLMDVLETFIGYMSNALSFMRVAGLGIAHVYIMGAFSDIAFSLDNKVLTIIILILANIIVIGLEGLSAGVQALRLNYYEFFTKYFTGRGIAYKPISLQNREEK